MFALDSAPHHTALTLRQREVLECALRLLIDGGEKALTTARLARAANCSKESLYKWFGDRDGLLAAVIAHQAAKVRIPADPGAPMDAETYRARLTAFVGELLNVLFGDTSLALNRLAIGQSHRADGRLGRVLLDRGKRTISARARALLEAGRLRGYLRFSDSAEAYEVLHGLAVRDVHVRLLLGDDPGDVVGDVDAAAEAAVARFYRLFGVGKTL